VGIAGEDDLDAPDLVAPSTPSPRTEEPTFGKRKSRLNGDPAHQQRAVSGVSRRNNRPNPGPLLSPGASATLRDRLVAELSEISSAEQATTWGLQALAAKNTLLAGAHSPAVPHFGMNAEGPAIEFARCFLRLANLPNFALDRLSRYEAAL